VEAVRPDFDEAAIRRYLLGLLPEPEAEALEEEYLGHAEMMERWRGVEDDLLDDYAAGRLGTDEKGAFESRCRASPLLRDRAVAARAIRLAAAGEAPTARLVPRRAWRWAGPSAIAASLLVAALAFWLWPSRPGEVAIVPAAPTSVARSETPSLEPHGTRPPVAAPSAAAPERPLAVTRLVFAVSPVLLRGQANAAQLRIPPTTTTVVLELEGDPALLPPPPARLDAIITTVEGRRIWAGEARRVDHPERPSPLASASVPARRLPAGDYLVDLAAGPDTLSRYFIRVLPWVQ
jgi:hypothetical protein